VTSTRLQWKTTAAPLEVAGMKIRCAANLRDGYHQGWGVKRLSGHGVFLRRLVWPGYALFKSLLIDGFIDRDMRRLIRRYLRPGGIFLEIGCGSMDLRSGLPAATTYNALDLEISEFHLRRCGPKSNVNVAVASATDIPLDDACVDLVVSSETFEHIPDVDKALAEVHRILRPQGVLLCSIPNNHCYKYAVKGQHPGHAHRWTYEDFARQVGRHGFELVEGHMKGFWIPLPGWVTQHSFQVALSVSEERFNTNFFYVFRVNNAWQRARFSGGSRESGHTLQ
jgi:ubiquinone/menaquinone biosynthesis C-methylase UbiE